MMLRRRRGNPTSFDAHRHRLMAFATSPSCGHLEKCVGGAETERSNRCRFSPDITVITVP